MEQARVVSVDGQNNAIIDLPLSAFTRENVDPVSHERFARDGAPTDSFRVRIGAACARFLGDVVGVGENPRRWPELLPHPGSRLLVQALPHAARRVEELRASGRRVPFAIYSNDIARVRGDDPLGVGARYRASAASTADYEALVAAIKARPISLEDRAEEIGRALLQVTVVDVKQQRYVPSIDADFAQSDKLESSPPPPMQAPQERDEPLRLVSELSTAAERFIESAALLASLLGEAADVDWSGVVIGYCKATEVEAVRRIVDPLCRSLREAPEAAPSDSDVDDRALGAVARYCVRDGRPPDIGALRFFLATAGTSRRRLATSRFLQTFVALADTWRGGTWLLDRLGAPEAFRELTERYRNRAAHTGELSYLDYVGCRDFVASDDGLLARLVEATSTKS